MTILRSVHPSLLIGFSAGLKQPPDAFQGVLNKFAAPLQRWPIGPEHMAKPIVSNAFRLHIILFSQHSLIEQTFIPQRIQSAQLKEYWWQVRQVWVQKWAEQWAGRVRLQSLHERVARVFEVLQHWIL